MSSVVQSKRGAATGTTVTVTLDAGATLGNLLLAMVAICTEDPEVDGSITGWTKVGSAAISGAGDEHIQFFAKVAAGGETGVTYTHYQATVRTKHLHLLELADVPDGTIRDKALGQESEASYDHDSNVTLDSTAWNTGPLQGTGLMLIGYSCNGTTNAAGWTVGAPFTLVAQPFNSSDGSVWAWADSTDEETIQLAGGNGRSGLSLMVNVLLAPSSGESAVARGRRRGWN